MDFKTTTINVSENRVKLAIWDTAGSERFRGLAPNFYRGAHGAILVYDVTNRESFNKLDTWLQELEVYSTRPGVLKMLVGNKIDKVASGDNQVVSKEEGLAWARKHSTLFIEASAKTSEGVRTAFEELVEKIIQSPDLWEPSNSGIKLSDSSASNADSWCQGWCGWYTCIFSTHHPLKQLYLQLSCAYLFTIKSSYYAPSPLFILTVSLEELVINSWRSSSILFPSFHLHSQQT